MKIRTSEASGVVLDWLVAKCECPKGWIVITEKRKNQESGEMENIVKFFKSSDKPYAAKWSDKVTPSTNWAQGGPIIEHEKIELRRFANNWQSVKRYDDYWVSQQGNTPLEAAMRCYVASKLGEEVEVPDEIGGMR